MFVQVTEQQITDQIADLSQHMTNKGRHQHPMDTAVKHLHASCTLGQMQGTFYGRLQNVVRVSGQGAVTAINAVLSEFTNLVSGGQLYYTA